VKTIEMEIAVANHFNARQNLIVPNVSWGFCIHECDLLIVTKAGYLYEVEIKVSRGDLKNDMKKQHNHYDSRIKNLYFAIPKKLEKDIEFIPKEAGIMLVHKKETDPLLVEKWRLPKITTEVETV